MESKLLTVHDEALDLSSDVFFVTADGTVRYTADGISAETLAALVTIDAGDTVDDW